MLIKEIMTTRVATVSMDDRLGVIKAIFEQAHFRHLLVLHPFCKLVFRLFNIFLF